MDIYQTIVNLQDQFVDKRGMPKKKIDIHTCCELIERLRQSVPESIEEANFVLANKQKILQGADTAAKNTIREAEERVAHILDDSDIRRRSEYEAKRLIDDTNSKCDNLITRTKEHLDGVFCDLEQFLMSALSLIRCNRDELNGIKSLSARKE